MATPKAVTSLKRKAHELIDQLPDDATWHDVTEALTVIQDIEAGLAESDADLGVDTAALRRHFSLSE